MMNIGQDWLIGQFESNQHVVIRIYMIYSYKQKQCFFRYIIDAFWQRCGSYFVEPNLFLFTLPETNSKSSWKFMVGRRTVSLGGWPSGLFLGASGLLAVCFRQVYLEILGEMIQFDEHIFQMVGWKLTWKFHETNIDHNSINILSTINT